MKGFMICCMFLVAVVDLGSCRSVPKATNAAVLARQIIHDTDWIGISTISTLDASLGYPFANLKSVADIDGVPFVLMTNLEYTAKDIVDDFRVGVFASMAQTGYCQEHGLIAQDPRCGRVLITGKSAKMYTNTQEYYDAKDALIAKHPVMKEWMELEIDPDHKFMIHKILIGQIIVMGNITGSERVELADYFAVEL